jgi:hypothetical protein
MTDLFADADVNESGNKTTADLTIRRCPNCMEEHSQCEANAAATVRQSIRAEIDNRLDRTEYLVAELHEGDRVAVARWIQGVLDRPPLSNGRARSLDPIRAVLDALWRDIYDATPDPLMHTFSYEGDSYAIERPHHELVEMRPDEYLA